MKLRTFFYSLAAIALVLLLVGAGGFYWIKSQSPLTALRDGKLIEPEAAIFVPKQAPVMASLLVNPDKLETFRIMAATPGERRKARAELNKLKQTVLANTGVDYRRDIKPWVGDEVTFAITTPDIDRNSKNGLQPGYLVAVAAKDPEQGAQFLDAFWQKQAVAGANLVSEQYKGVKLIHNDAGKSKKKIPDLATAAIGNGFVLFANDLKVLRDAINNVQAPELNLSSSSDYQQALQRLKLRQIGLTYLNLPALTAWLGNETNETPASASESLAISLGFNPQGLLAQLALLGNQSAESLGDEANDRIHPLEKPVAALQYLPASTAFAAAGSDLRQLWAKIQPELSDPNSLLSLVYKPLANLQAQWGIELPQDIFSWVQGEYAFGLLPLPDKTQPDWIFVAERSANTTAAVEHLNAIAKQRGFSLGNFSLENQNIFAWTRLTTTQEQGPMRLKTEVSGVHATVGNYEIFTSSIEAMDRAILAPQNSLVASNDFKASIAPLSQPNLGYVYLNWPSSQGFLESKLPILKIVEQTGKALFDNLRSLTLSSYKSDDLILRSSLFVRLGKAL